MRIVFLLFVSVVLCWPSSAVAAVSLSIDSAFLDLSGGNSQSVQLPVRVDVTDSAVDLGAVSLGMTWDTGGSPITATPNVAIALPGEVFGAANFISFDDVPDTEIAVFDFGDSDVTLAVGQYVLAELLIDVSATGSGSLSLDFVPELTQLSNSGGEIAGVTLVSGSLSVGTSVIPEPAMFAVVFIALPAILRRKTLR